MPKPVRIDADAEQELREARDWYDLQRPLLGNQLLEEVRSALRQIADQPDRYAIAPDTPEHLGIRKRALRRFPFTIFYTELLHEIRVLAIAHAKRRPGYWQGRIDR